MEDILTLTSVSIPKKPIKLSEEEGKLLEHYAGLAMQAIINNIETLKVDEDYDHVSVALDAFKFADAMMGVRNELKSA